MKKRYEKAKQRYLYLNIGLVVCFYALWNRYNVYM